MFSLRQNFPNPFNPTTRFQFGLPQLSSVRLVVYNPLGQVVARVFENVTLDAGMHEVVFDGSRLASGIYFYRLDAVGVMGPTKRFSDVRKMTLMK